MDSHLPWFTALTSCIGEVTAGNDMTGAIDSLVDSDPASCVTFEPINGYVTQIQLRPDRRIVRMNTRVPLGGNPSKMVFHFMI